MKKIKLINGDEVLVDDQDFAELSKYRWRLNSNYAACNIPGVGLVLMHRLIVNPKDGERIDHINGNSLDNRRKNLRIATHTQNMQNRKLHKNNTSGYKGVYYHRTDAKAPKYPWKAEIRVNNKKIHIGYFETSKEAALAYNRAAKKYHGEFAKLNDI